MTVNNYILSPINESQRFRILDILRGMALLGICMANFPEFALYSFLDSAAKDCFDTARIDKISQWMLYIFVDGKFYTIFSLLFGIGFSIIISNARNKGAKAFRIFYRRMFVLLLIGFVHLIFVWSGDILMLYALMGMLLSLCFRLSDRSILITAAILLFLPVIIDTMCEILGLHLSAGLTAQQWYYCAQYGITEENFAYWLRDVQSYPDMLKFLIQGAFERMQEFVDGNRYFKVLGLFMIGFYIGRNRLYADLDLMGHKLYAILKIGIIVGLPLSCLYAWDSMEGHPFGIGFHSLLYFLSVYITGFGYVAAICLLYKKFSDWTLWKLLSCPGRMALTNYIGQSVWGVILFYGIAFGLGTTVGLFYVELIVLGIFIMEMAISFAWLQIFRFGPLEWIWRCLTYGKFFSILKN